MKIAHIYDSQCGRNDGAPLYTLEALKRRKELTVSHYLPKGDPNLWGNHDLYFWVDFADDALGYGEFPCPKPNFYWCSDYHINSDSYAYRLKRARQFDWVGCYQKRNVEEFIRDGIPEEKIFWLPTAFEKTCYRPGVFSEAQWESDKEKVLGERGWINAETIKRYDLCFIGHINNQKRMDYLHEMFKAIPNFFYGTKRFEKCAQIFNQSKIVFNTSHADDLNMRVMEVLGTKSFLLTENIPSIHELFKEGVHLVTYSSIDEAIEKANYYISHDEEREKIAEAGYNLVLSRDTYDHRIQQVLDIIKSGNKNSHDLFPINRLMEVV